MSKEKQCGGREEKAGAAKRWHHRASSERQEAEPQQVVSLPFHPRALLSLSGCQNRGQRERTKSGACGRRGAGTVVTLKSPPCSSPMKDACLQGCSFLS